MNALNILSGLGSTPSTPTKSRTSSLGSIHIVKHETKDEADDDETLVDAAGSQSAEDQDLTQSEDDSPPKSKQVDEQSFDATEQTRSRAGKVPRRILDAIIGALRWILAAIMAPGHLLVSGLVDRDGTFAPMTQLSQFYEYTWPRKRRKTAPVVAEPEPLSSQTPSDDKTQSPHNTRSKTAVQEEAEPLKRSIRIKLEGDAARQRRRSSAASRDSQDDSVSRIATALKSPSNAPLATKLKYPHAPAPPRPLVPRRQPSFTTTSSTHGPKKTLIIDLDETLIHSMAKGGRMSTGHMVEVRLSSTVSGHGVSLGPQVPILYYVHERPYCHEFLRKVCKWYNLIIFTASVQEYADPVIDWLERERAYFSGRYYRQHCTYRNGAYIKDLSHVEPDLSKVMILDNSPMSYIFHEGVF